MSAQHQWVRLSQAFFGRGVAAFGMLLLTSVVSRTLEPTEAGSFFLFLSLVAGLSIISKAGVDVYLIKNVADKKEKDPSRRFLLVNALAAVFSVSFLVVLAWVFIGYIFSFTGLLSEWGWVLIIPFSLQFVVSGYLKGRSASGVGSLLEGGLIFLVTAIWIVLFDLRTSGEFLIALACASWVIFIFSMLLLRDAYVGNLASLNSVSHVLTCSVRFFGISVLAFLSQWGLLMLLGVLSDPENVAYVNGIFRILAPMQFVQITMDYYLSPKFAARTAGDVRKIRNFGSITAFILSVPYVVLCVVFPELVLRVILGVEYVHLSGYLAVIVFVHALLLLLGSNGIILSMRDNEGFVLFSTAGRVIVAFSLAVPLIVFVSPLFVLAAYTIALTFQNLVCRLRVDRCY